MQSATLFLPEFGIVLSNKDALMIPLILETIPSAGEFRAAVSSLSPEQERFCTLFRGMQMSATLFTVGVIQLKPNLERVLTLEVGALTKEIALGQRVQELLLSYQVSPDLLSGSSVDQVRAHAEVVYSFVKREKDAQLAEARRLAEVARLERETRERQERLQRLEEEARRRSQASYYNSINYKICVLGAGGVGKSSLTIQFVANHFVEDYDPTIEDSYRKQVVIDDESCILEILDTCSQEEFTALRDQWIRDCELFVLVYSITSRSSFEELTIFKDQVLRVKDKDRIPMVIAANKCDLADMREVTTQEGLDLARAYGTLFKETSAKLRVNVEEIFYDLVRKGRSYRSFAGGGAKSAAKKKGGGFALPSFNVVGKIQSARREREIMRSATSSTSSSSSSSSSSRSRGNDSSSNSGSKYPVIDLDFGSVASTGSKGPQERVTVSVSEQTAVAEPAADTIAAAAPSTRSATANPQAADDSDAFRPDLSDVSTLPNRIEALFDANEGDGVGTVRPTIIKCAPIWEYNRQPSLANPNATITEKWDPTRQSLERKKCFDLLDGISRSGAFALTHCEFHVIQCATHLFDSSVMDAVLKDNINPIQQMQRAQVLMASAIHEVEESTILK